MVGMTSSWVDITVGQTSMVGLLSLTSRWA
jgi:hypothetical protein